MHRNLPAALCALALGAGCAAAAAPPGDPAHSAACRQALATLQAHEATLAAARAAAAAHAAPVPDAPDPAPESLRTLRQAAARACLGGSDGLPAPPSQHLRQPPITVAPAAALPPLPAPGSVPGPLPAAATRSVPPALVGACDSTGCWTSTGQRLQRFGSGLLGPHGVCTLQGGLLQCP